MISIAADEAPEWDLTDLYAGMDDPELRADLERAAADAAAFADAYDGRLQRVDGPGLAKAITDYEILGETLSRAMSFAQLMFAADSSDPATARFYQSVKERVTAVSSRTVFFELQLNDIDDAAMAALMETPEVGRYASWIRTVRELRPHQLSDELERLLHEKSVTGRGAWNRLFDETMSAMRFVVDEQRLTSGEVLDMMSDPDGARRETAARAFADGLGRNIRLLALITNTLAKDKEIEDRWRKFPRPVSRRNLSNRVEDEVVDALVQSVSARYEDIAHRYYLLKARWMGLGKLQYWDRNAPLPDAGNRVTPWNEARETVLGAYGAFSPEMAERAAVFFDRSWIDARPREGKDSGAFSHPTVPSAHPYILMNYRGRARDIMTLAHELGHGVHQTLAAPQGQLLADTPLTLAETASVFGEMLTFRALLDREDDAAAKRVMLASKIEDMINTVIRQTAFYEFEQQVHDERPEGELGPERLGEIWMSIQGRSLGPAFEFDPSYACYWAYIPHFVHSPFYVYAYAFGDCLVNSLYELFRDGHPDFQAKYLEMLKAGGTLRHKELLAPFGLDAGDPGFWERGLNVVSGFVDELEATF